MNKQQIVFGLLSTLIFLGCDFTPEPVELNAVVEVRSDESANAPQETVTADVDSENRLDEKQYALAADSHPLTRAPAELHLILQQSEMPIDFRYVDHDGYPHEGCHWRIDLSDDLLQAHIKHFQLQPVSQGRLTKKMFRKFPSDWPDLSAVELRWYAWPGNGDDGYSHRIWSIMAVDPVASELYFFRQNCDTTP